MKKYFSLTLRIIIAVILIQTLNFKFFAHPNSVYIFNKVGLEPYGRIGIGMLELVASILIIIPKTIWVGAILTIGIIGGAIFMHLTQLGVEINNDNGLLFIKAIVTFVLSFIVLFLYKKDIPLLLK